MEHLQVGSITFNPSDSASLDEALDIFRRLKFSNDAGWDAFFKVDYELSKIKDVLCKSCLLKVEGINDGKEIHGENRPGNRGNCKKVRRNRSTGKKP